MYKIQGFEFESPKTIVLPQIESRFIKIKIRGTSPLILHKFSTVSSDEMEDKQTGKATKNKKTLARNPQKELDLATYTFNGESEKYGITCRALKTCARDAARYVGSITIVLARTAFFVIPDGYDGHEPIVEIKGKREMLKTIERIGSGMNKVPTPRYRPMWREWEMEFFVKFNPDLISIEQLFALFQQGGANLGLGEDAPWKTGGINGMFELVMATVEEEDAKKENL